MISSYSSYHPGAKLVARQGIEKILSPNQQRRPLPSVLHNTVYPSSMVQGFPHQKYFLFEKEVILRNSRRNFEMFGK